MKRSRLFISLPLILVSAYSIAHVSVQRTLPAGWRLPRAVEATGAWRKKSPTRFLVVRGDFDGDGREDVAELLEKFWLVCLALQSAALAVNPWSRCELR